MSLYPLSIDRHPAFEDTRWQRSCTSELSHWQSTSRAHYDSPDLPHHYRPYPDPSAYHQSSYLPPHLEPQQPYVLPPAYSPSLSCVSSLSKHSEVDSWGNTLYRIEDDVESSDSRASPEQTAPVVKAEPQDSFIMELRGSCSGEIRQQAPSNKVPLRATHACGEMLSMMGVFRLNPFIVGGAACVPQENTGLDQSPLMFEFTIELPEEFDCEEGSSQGDEEPEEYLGYPEKESYVSDREPLYCRNSFSDWSLADRERGSYFYGY